MCLARRPDLILDCRCIEAVLVPLRKRFALLPSFGGFCILGWRRQPKLRSPEQRRAFCPTDDRTGEGITAGLPAVAGAFEAGALAPALGVRKPGTLCTMECILSAAGVEC